MDGDKYLTIQMQTWRKTIYNNNRDLIFHFGNYTYYFFEIYITDGLMQQVADTRRFT